jgi:hypothetical protein
MPQLCPALRLSRRYSVMKNTLIQRRLERAARTKLLLVCSHAVSDSSRNANRPRRRGDAGCPSRRAHDRQGGLEPAAIVHPTSPRLRYKSV